MPHGTASRSSTAGMPWLAIALLVPGVVLPTLLSSSPVRARACAPGVMRSLSQLPTPQDDTVRIDCDLSLKPTDVVVRRLVFAGQAASGSTLDCQGGAIGTAQTKTSYRKPTITVRSVRQKAGTWSVPRNITIRNCKVRGNIRLIGLGSEGEAKYVRLSSLNRNHTQNAQANAPSGITFENLTITATVDIPLYFGPGVTKSAILNSRIGGHAKKTAIYLDAESAGNTISGNTFIIDAGRELIAVDGSARNTITRNTFNDPLNGGIYLYRNCGEGGTIRHQPPQHNLIALNIFNYKMGLARPAIWLNMRDVGKWFCTKDPDHPFGSSLDSSDQAKFNTVRDNRFNGLWTPAIINFDGTNTVSGNR